MSETGPPRRRERLVAIPGVVAVCCLVLLGLFAAYGLMTEATRTWVLVTFAFVPARMAIALDVAHDSLQASAQRLPQETFTALIGAGGGRWWTLITYPLVHTGWPQAFANVSVLAVFGAPVARRLGAARFLILLAAATLVGALVQFAWDAASFVPIVGASPAVSGVLGAAARFAFPPGAGGAAVLDPADHRGASPRPSLSLVETFTSRTTLLLVGAWIAYSLLIELYPLLPGTLGRPPAWPAWIAGFLLSVLAFPLLDPRQRAEAAT